VDTDPGVAHPNSDPLPDDPGFSRARDERGAFGGGLGRDPQAAPGRADAGQGDRTGAGDLEEHGAAAIASDRSPKYERKPAGSIVDAAEPRIRELLRAYPAMPATVIAGRIGWDRSIRVLRARVTELRPAYLPPDPASRTAYEPGEVARCDL
jgi:hypothetical protein